MQKVFFLYQIPKQFEMLPLFFFHILLLINVAPSAESYYLETECKTNRNYTQDSVYQKNLIALLQNLVSQSSNTKFYNATRGESPDIVHGKFICRDDGVNQYCGDCVKAAAQAIHQNCSGNREAIIWYGGCTLRYANRQLMYLQEDFPPSYSTYSISNMSGHADGFLQTLSDTMENLIQKAAYDNDYHGYATEEADVPPYQKLYCLVQCSPDILGLTCHKCLQTAYSFNQNCCDNGKFRAMIYLPDCFLRYDTAPFYPIDPDDDKKDEKGVGYYMIRAFVPAVGFVILLLCCVAFYLFKRRKKQQRLTGGINTKHSNSTESVHFSLATIKSATQNFSIDNKLGEGGFGPVYKGKLPNGEEVAVKRLSQGSRQGLKEIANEVHLLAKLQHRNLVRLLGFCLEGEEKILVYEFVTNLSLDKFIFDLSKRKYLDWETRFKIIVGIARGLLYLHEDSRLKIIHRDLKSSNILLDEEMNPKIADFGMAKLLQLDETQANTSKIVGTYGYMAPEYATSGACSIKSDVYSFGVILLEIISGQSNSLVNQSLDKDSLLARAWKLWNTRAVMELVDSTLGNNYSNAEVLKCIQVGLLCVQQDATRRPTMASVLIMLIGNSSDENRPGGPVFESQESEPYNRYPSVGYTEERLTDLYPR